MYSAAPRLPDERSIAFSDLSKNILRVVLYFDIFKHPLKAKEIYRCCSIKGISQLSVEEELKCLVAQNLLATHDGFYFSGRDESYVERRLNGEEKAGKSLRIARRFSGLIAGFPFVRAVLISGSLSKGYMDNEADIDYFVVTAPGRLWLSRSLLMLFKKIVLLNSRKYFCVNYFVDSQNLYIPDNNFFTATELAFILPTYNYELYCELMNKNSWVKNYYPHFPLFDEEGVLPERNSYVKSFLEACLNGKIGEKLDIFFFRITLKHWKKKFAHFDGSTFDHRLRSKKSVSKHHPKGFQEKILTGWEKKIYEFEMKHGVILK